MCSGVRHGGRLGSGRAGVFCGAVTSSAGGFSVGRCLAGEPSLGTDLGQSSGTDKDSGKSLGGVT